MAETIYDCIIIGAGPGGLQAAVHLGRFNRQVLVLDRGGGRTRHAVHIENYLGIETISGQQLIALGLEQARRLGVKIERSSVQRLTKEQHFIVEAGEQRYLARCVLAASGATENLPRLRDLHRFFATSFFTCVICDGYRATAKKLLILANSADSARLALGMKQLYTRNITLLMAGARLPQDVEELLAQEQIRLIYQEPVALLGEERLEGARLRDDTIVTCEVIMSQYGYTINDQYLAGLALERDSGGKIITNRHGETSVAGLYATGALRQGNSQAIIAAGQGAEAAIEINKRLMEF